ncbi:MAG: hypothetical protein KAH23_05190 [Kiritimatiellae bacterium]|nr:hypothetical protein [Kiritimatiellia bacterium]
MAIVVLSKCVGMSRQNFHKTREERKRQKVDEGLVSRLVQAERAVQS